MIFHKPKARAHAENPMVGGSGLSMLFLGAVGAFAAAVLGSHYSWLLALVGIPLGGAAGIFAGALGWESCNDFGDKCRRAFLNGAYVRGLVWLFASLASLLLAYGGMLGLLVLAARVSR